jgi:hypothetical protein
MPTFAFFDERFFVLPEFVAASSSGSRFPLRTLGSIFSDCIFSPVCNIPEK